MYKNIVLVGFMGAGKTTIASLLAEKLKRKYVSTDDMIIHKERTSISVIFKQKGEPYFRELEREIVSKLSRQGGLVIDCGGGIVLQEENIIDLKKNGIIIFLKASADAVHERTKKTTHRPLLRVANPRQKIEELLVKREPYYKQADLTIDTSAKTADEVVHGILCLIQYGERRRSSRS